MLVQYLFSTVKKSKEDLTKILTATNIQGNILVCVQLMDNEEAYTIKTDRYTARVFNSKTVGVSKNRNILINKAEATYVTFLDDDMYYESGAQSNVENVLSSCEYNCVRFNIVSDNKARPIEILKKKGLVGYRKLSPFGVCGCFYKLGYLKNNNLYFREDVGPGTNINHGEDGLFNNCFTRFSKVYNIPLVAFHARQETTTWHDEHRDLNKEMVSHGFIYYLMYNKFAKIMSRIFLATHMYCFPEGTDKKLLKKKMFEGIEFAKTTKYKRSDSFRALILGPTINKQSGGVAVFTEGLYKGFVELGDEAQIISATKSSNINNLTIKKRDIAPNKILFNFRKIAKLIKNYQPDLVISSLQYSIGIKKYKRYWKHATYVQVLHGTPCPVNGRFKAWCVNFVARYSKKHFDKLVTVSHLSWAINKKINRVECDEVINVGCSLKPINTSSTKIYDFCYVGRLYRDKNIDKIINALILLHNENNNLKVCIAGYGELEYLFKKGGKYNLDFIDFKGKVSQDKAAEIYSMSKFFISLCELEACGISFAESAINGCNPISSLSSGQTYLFRNKKYYHTVDTSSIDSLNREIKQTYSNYVEISRDEIRELIELFDYKNIALKYKKLLS